MAIKWTNDILSTNVAVIGHSHRRRKRRRDRSTRKQTLHFFLQKETQNGSQTEVENGESIKLLEDITGEQQMTFRYNTKDKIIKCVKLDLLN